MAQCLRLLPRASSLLQAHRLGVQSCSHLDLDVLHHPACPRQPSQSRRIVTKRPGRSRTENDNFTGSLVNGRPWQPVPMVVPPPAAGRGARVIGDGAPCVAPGPLLITTTGRAETAGECRMRGEMRGVCAETDQVIDGIGRY